MLRSYDRKLDQRYFPTSTCVMSGDSICSSKAGLLRQHAQILFQGVTGHSEPGQCGGVGSVATYPFGRGGFEVSKLEEATAKRYLPAAKLSKLKSSTASNPQCEYARKLFLFSYYCYGISSSTWRCSRPPILNKWRTATISFTSGKRSNGRKVSNRFRSRSRLRSGN